MSAALVEAIERVKRDCPNAPFVPVPIAVAQSLTTRIAELEAENERLRTGLERLGQVTPCHCTSCTVMGFIARATLTETSDDR